MITSLTRILIYRAKQTKHRTSIVPICGSMFLSVVAEVKSESMLGRFGSSLEEYDFIRKSQRSGESSNSPTPNSDFTLTAKDSTPREQIAYICGLRTRIECEPVSKHSTHSDRVTNIGYLLS